MDIIIVIMFVVMLIMGWFIYILWEAATQAHKNIKEIYRRTNKTSGLQQEEMHKVRHLETDIKAFKSQSEETK